MLPCGNGSPHLRSRDILRCKHQGCWAAWQDLPCVIAHLMPAHQQQEEETRLGAIPHTDLERVRCWVQQTYSTSTEQTGELVRLRGMGSCASSLLLHSPLLVVSNPPPGDTLGAQLCSSVQLHRKSGAQCSGLSQLNACRTVCPASLPQHH